MNLAKLAWLGFALIWAAPGCAQTTPNDGGDSSSSGSGPTGLLSYRFKREIKIAGASMPIGAALSFPIDHATLVKDKKATADGKDLRVGYELDGAANELPRALDPASAWNSASSVVWFRTPDKTLTGAHFFVYYGNEHPGTLNDDRTKIYDAWEDFRGALNNPTWMLAKLGMADGKFELTKVLDQKGEYVDVLRVTGQSNDFAGAADDGVFFHQSFSGDFVADVKIAGAGGNLGGPAKLGGLMVRQTLDVDSAFAAITVQDLPRERVTLARTMKGDPASAAQLPLEGKCDLMAKKCANNAIQDCMADEDCGFPQYVEVQRIGNQITTGYYDGTAWIGMGMATTIADLGESVFLGVPFSNISSDYGYADIGWLRVYKRLNPPPTVSLGKEI
jgi:hypothetical protein